MPSIKLLWHSHTPGATGQIGDVLDVTDAVYEHMIAIGGGIPAAEPPETAAADAAPENAAQPKPRRRRKKADD